ncbi:MAG TPA: hypothetical protein VIY51_01970 [Xanthobacteraceae bacterium]
MPRNQSAQLLLTVASAMWLSQAGALELSTNVTSPGPMPANGVIDGNYPASTGETAYYFEVDLKAGTLASQVWVKGPDAPKRLWLALLDASGSKIEEYAVDSSFSDDGDNARNWQINHTGRYTVRLTTKGPELATYRVEFGGSAFAGHQPGPVDASGYSHSFLDPTHIGPSAVITGTFPAARTTTTYYFDADLKAGVLMTQLSMAARKELGGTKWMMLEILGPDGAPVDKTQLERTFAPNSDGTHNFAINHSGHYVMRVAVRGTEGTKYKVELGGDALASAQ